MPRLDEGSILIETRKLPSVSLPDSVDDLHAGRADRQAFPGGPRRRHQDRPARSRHRGDGHLPGRRLRPAAPDRRRGRTGRTKESLIEALAAGAARRCPASRSTSRSRWPCGVDEVVSGREGRRRGQDLRRRTRPCSNGSAARWKASSPGCPAQPTCRRRCSRARRRSRSSIDRDAAARYGINVAHVQELVETADRRHPGYGGARRRAPVRGARAVPEEHRRDLATIAGADAHGAGRRESAALARGPRRPRRRRRRR